MPIPQSRYELLELIESEFGKLSDELDGMDSEFADTICVDDWSVKDLIAVRLWWSRSVLNWVDKGIDGKVPTTPAPGYRWRETPRLNNDIVAKSSKRSFKAIVADLKRQYGRLIKTIDNLDDRELLDVGVFSWAGRYPVSRWLSINTARQYHTARTYIRRAKRLPGNR